MDVAQAPTDSPRTRRVVYVRMERGVRLYWVMLHIDPPESKDSPVTKFSRLLLPGSVAYEERGDSDGSGFVRFDGCAEWRLATHTCSGLEGVEQLAFLLRAAVWEAWEDMRQRRVDLAFAIERPSSGWCSIELQDGMSTDDALS